MGKEDLGIVGGFFAGGRDRRLKFERGIQPGRVDFQDQQVIGERNKVHVGNLHQEREAGGTMDEAFLVEGFRPVRLISGLSFIILSRNKMIYRGHLRTHAYLIATPGMRVIC